MIGWIATAATWLNSFRGPCLILAVAAALGGAGTATWATRAVMDGKVVRAEARMRDAELAVVKAERDQLQRDITLREEVRREYDSKLDGIAALAHDIQRRVGAVRLCRVPPSAGDLQVPGAAGGTDAAGEGGQSGDIGPALVQLAERCDRTAEQLNALISWMARHQ